MLPGPSAPDLPDLFLCEDGTRVHTAGGWLHRREEITNTLLTLQYGPLPPVPDTLRCTLLHAATLRRMGSALLLSCRINIDRSASFMLRVFLPAGDGPFPVVLNGDGCWLYASDGVITTVLQRGYAFAQFNRVEVASDPPVPALDAQFAERSGPTHGAIAAWAWAYHRAIDALQQVGQVDSTRVAVVGHSRGGKASLLAGATDSRITLTSANNSGAGGAGCWRHSGPGAETLADITQAFPHWFAPALSQYAGREHALPFDQHFLKALVAPRALLTTEALGDLWANPAGTWQTHIAARAAYRLLGAEGATAVAYREGGHDHSPADWDVLLDHCDLAMRGSALKPAPHHVYALPP